jgi:hypothetical protein
MTLFVQVSHVINGCIFTTYPCKYQDGCNKYNPALTLIDKRTVEFLNCCTHGGGAGCASWRNKTNRLLGGYDPFQNRSYGSVAKPGNVVACKASIASSNLAIPSSKVLDATEMQLKQLKNIKDLKL